MPGYIKRNLDGIRIDTGATSIFEYSGPEMNLNTAGFIMTTAGSSAEFTLNQNSLYPQAWAISNDGVGSGGYNKSWVYGDNAYTGIYFEGNGVDIEGDYISVTGGTSAVTQTYLGRDKFYAGAGDPTISQKVIAIINTQGASGATATSLTSNSGLTINDSKPVFFSSVSSRNTSITNSGPISFGSNGGTPQIAIGNQGSISFKDSTQDNAALFNGKITSFEGTASRNVVIATFSDVIVKGSATSNTILGGRGDITNASKQNILLNNGGPVTVDDTLSSFIATLSKSGTIEASSSLIALGSETVLSSGGSFNTTIGDLDVTFGATTSRNSSFGNQAIINFDTNSTYNSAISNGAGSITFRGSSTKCIAIGNSNNPLTFDGRTGAVAIATRGGTTIANNALNTTDLAFVHGPDVYSILFDRSNSPLTADHVIRFQDAGGTLAYLSDIGSGGTAYASDGNGLQLAGPTFSLGGTVSSPITYNIQSGQYVDFNGPGTVTIQHAAVGNAQTAPTGLTNTIDWNDGNFHTMELGSVGSTGAVVLTMNNPLLGAVYSLKIIQGANLNSITWPLNVKWESGSILIPTTINNAEDIVTMIYDGTSYLASYGKNYV